MAELAVCIRMNITQTEYMRPDDVAKLLLVNVRTVRNWVAAGRLPAIKIGRVLLIARDDLNRFLDASRYGSSPPAPPAQPAAVFSTPPPPPAPQPVSASQLRKQKRGGR